MKDTRVTKSRRKVDNDKQEQLADYAKALSADSRNWWFLNAGDTKATHTYLEKELKFGRRVQAALLPTKLPKRLKGVDVHASFSAAREKPPAPPPWTLPSK